ncbi:MAG: cysteine hydrolase [Bacteroidetes bacterium]|nr:cysteine hydrolase [Bacteroidota bacterium]
MKNLLALILLCFCMFPSNLKAQERTLNDEGIKKIVPALLVIDIQNEFLPFMSETDRKSAMDTINKAIAIFHEKKLPVIRVYHHDIERGPHPGSEGFEFPKSVQITESDPRVIKHYANAFTKTCLDSLLKTLGVNTVFLCGLSATGCVLGTYFGGMDHDYLTLMLKDGLISPKTEQTAMIREICSGLNYGIVKTMLNRKP